MVARHDRMRAAVLARDPRLLVARDGADDDGAEAARPRADEQADAAGGRMDEQARPGADVAEVAQEEVGGDALQQRRRGDVVLDRRRQANDPLGRHRPHAAIRAGRLAEVGDAVARKEAAHARADVDDRADRLHARHAGQRQHRRDPALAQVDVEVVDADRALADPHLAGSRAPAPRRRRAAGPRARRSGARRRFATAAATRSASPRRRDRAGRRPRADGGAGWRSPPRRRRAPPSRAARARARAASRRSTPSARTCGRRRSPASASPSRRSAAAARSPRRCSRCSCARCPRARSAARGCGCRR